MKVLSSAPSNIALIKYMGKTADGGNRPTNASLSYTLEHLRTFVQISALPHESTDRWQLLTGEGLQKMELSSKGQERFLQHFQNLKKIWQIEQNFLIESANNFPSDCGLASSASSFAALTKAAAELFQMLNPQVAGLEPKNLSQMARMGSGSSCRSFFSPWGLWQDEYAEPIKLEYNDLHHLVVIVEAQKKEVSSSEAHRRVVTSPRFAGRVERADMRLKDLIHSLRFKDWSMAVQICWDEFMDMHRLFETSVPSFSYMTEDSKTIINECKAQFDRWGDGPLITMDAGANVHLLFRQDQSKVFKSMQSHFAEKFQTIASPLDKTKESPL